MSDKDLYMTKHAKDMISSKLVSHVLEVSWSKAQSDISLGHMEMFIHRSHCNTYCTNHRALGMEV